MLVLKSCAGSLLITISNVFWKCSAATLRPASQLQQLTWRSFDRLSRAFHHFTKVLQLYHSILKLLLNRPILPLFASQMMRAGETLRGNDWIFFRHPSTPQSQRRHSDRIGFKRKYRICQVLFPRIVDPEHYQEAACIIPSSYESSETKARL